jgi:hypothetical protein
VKVVVVAWRNSPDPAQPHDWTRPRACVWERVSEDRLEDSVARAERYIGDPSRSRWLVLVFGAEDHDILARARALLRE